MPPCVWETELLEFLEQSKRVAFGFAKRQGRGNDRMFIDECQVEAAFIATFLMMTKYEEIRQANPTIEERQKYLRVLIGYGLKKYFSYRSSSSITYLRQKGMKCEHIPLNSIILARNNDDITMFENMESYCRDEVDQRIIDMHAMGMKPEQTAAKLELSKRFVLRTLRRIRKAMREGR